MMITLNGKSFRFKAVVWLYEGHAAWHFITVEKKISEKLKKLQEGKRRLGWGSVRVEATIGKSVWKTSVFPDKGGVYLLPVKASVRKAEGIYADEKVSVTLKLL
jgi:hypothetical protein